MERPFIRDVCFYLVSAFWAFCIFWRQQIFWGDAVGFLVLYFIYIASIIIGRIIHERYSYQDLPTMIFHDQSLDLEIEEDNPQPHHSEHHGSETPPLFRTSRASLSLSPETGGESSSVQEEEKPETSTVSMVSMLSRSLSFVSGISTDDQPTIPETEENLSVKESFRLLFKSINSFRSFGFKEEWKEASILNKCYMVIVYFINDFFFGFSFFIPVVDKTRPRNNWVQYLAIIQCIAGRNVNRIYNIIISYCIGCRVQSTGLDFSVCLYLYI